MAQVERCAYCHKTHPAPQLETRLDMDEVDGETMIRKSRNGDFWLIDGGTHTDAWCEANGTLSHDTNMLPLILPYIPVGGVVADAGSYIGDHTFSYLQKVGPTGQVLAFEPNPEAFQCLKLNCPEAICFQVALSDREGIGELIPAADCNYGTARVVPTDGFTSKEFDVALMPLDALMLRRLQFCKIDTEGSELRVLKGAAETIKQHRPVLLVEVNQSALEGMGTSPAELLDFIKDLGYSTQNIYPRQEAAGLQWDCLCKQI
jgi:FkbM family methyltransferase